MSGEWTPGSPRGFPLIKATYRYRFVNDLGGVEMAPNGMKSATIGINQRQAVGVWRWPAAGRVSLEMFQP
jgi:hypothetical protein